MVKEDEPAGVKECSSDRLVPVLVGTEVFIMGRMNRHDCEEVHQHGVQLKINTKPSVKRSTKVPMNPLRLFQYSHYEVHHEILQAGVFNVFEHFFHTIPGQLVEAALKPLFEYSFEGVRSYISNTECTCTKNRLHQVTQRSHVNVFGRTSASGSSVGCVGESLPSHSRIFSETSFVAF